MRRRACRARARVRQSPIDVHRKSPRAHAPLHIAPLFHTSCNRRVDWTKQSLDAPSNRNRSCIGAYAARHAERHSIVPCEQCSIFGLASLAPMRRTTSHHVARRPRASVRLWTRVRVRRAFARVPRAPFTCDGTTVTEAQKLTDGCLAVNGRCDKSQCKRGEGRTWRREERRRK